MIDEVESFEPGQNAIAYKNVSDTEICRQAESCLHIFIHDSLEGKNAKTYMQMKKTALRPAFLRKNLDIDTAVIYNYLATLCK